jgi:exosortase A-associated hydrolase 1
MSVEVPIVFDCRGDRLVGVVARPESPSRRGVVIVVGGPQYRAGSHRQFVLLARRLAQDGYPTLRFDYRGMGDSEGEPRAFTAIDDDIAAAIDALQRAVPGVTEVVLWGLCDAASALALYAARDDPRVAGLALVNPWVRSSETYAATQVRHYYLARLFRGDTWRRALAGELRLIASLADALRSVRTMLRRRRPSIDTAWPFQARMAEGVLGYRRGVLVVLSGDDLTAREFADRAEREPAWRAALARDAIVRRELPEADHTFSRAAWRERVEQWTLDWVRSL